MIDTPGFDLGVLLAVITAVASASGFAVSTSLQHRVASSAPASVRTAATLLRFVVRKPLWLLGISTGAVALVLHAVALDIGAIALVQPIMIAGVVFSVLVRAGLDRQWAPAGEVRAVTVTALGLAAFLVVADPDPGSGAPDEATAGLVTAAGLLLAVIGALIARRMPTERVRALVLGVAAGVLFGVTAGLLKLIMEGLDLADPIETVVSWPVLALACAGGLGMALNQRAYQIAPLSVSMPVLNIVDVLVAVSIGLVVFGEVPAGGPVALAVQAAALVCMGIGLRQIARYHDAAAARAHDPDPATRSST